MVKWSQNICILVNGNHSVSKLVSFFFVYKFLLVNAKYKMPDGLYEVVILFIKKSLLFNQSCSEKGGGGDVVYNTNYWC